GRDPGVWFFSLDAACRLAVVAARTMFYLPYHFATMSLVVTGDSGRGGPTSLVYASERHWPAPRSAHCSVAGAPSGPVGSAQPGSLEHFLAERYLLYASRRGKLYRGQVNHTPYPLQTAEINAIEETMLSASGLSRPPGTPLTHYARGVNVEVFP